MDWRGFVDTLQARGYSGPFEIENEAKNSKDTGNFAATNQGFTTCIHFLAPMLWDLDVEQGYTYRNENRLKNVHVEDIPVVTIDQL